MNELTLDNRSVIKRHINWTITPKRNKFLTTGSSPDILNNSETVGAQQQKREKIKLG